jgi:hypothetical protein
MVLTRNQVKAAAEAIAWNGPMTRSKLAARNRWTASAADNTVITIEDVAAATILMDLKDGWVEVEPESIATRRPRRSCRRD